MKKFIILSTIILFIGLLSFFFKNPDFKENEVVNYGHIYGVGELPVTIDQIPLLYQIEEVDGDKLLKVSYTNHTSNDISNFSVQLKIKDNQKPITINFSQAVKQGETSSVSEINISDDIQTEDITAVKYMISLTKGIYIEYDAITNQYNWS
ncbi:hypothetical protein [Turicibacter sanguinis]|uniref:hypothetical protein n=1 Tax=Turicibacter sanguinis TaxID=154288 RepID=UPI002943D332|nr:hypothetical protein [Turicibacter sanguinis]